jgi:hypothetical protein
MMTMSSPAVMKSANDRLEETVCAASAKAMIAPASPP